MITNSLTHPGLDRFGRSYDWFSEQFAQAWAVASGWQGWKTLMNAFHRWGEARVYALAMQDPRVRAEIRAAALRQERSLER